MFCKSSVRFSERSLSANVSLRISNGERTELFSSSFPSSSSFLPFKEAVDGFLLSRTFGLGVKNLCSCQLSSSDFVSSSSLSPAAPSFFKMIAEMSVSEAFFLVSGSKQFCEVEFCDALIDVDTNN